MNHRCKHLIVAVEARLNSWPPNAAARLTSVDFSTVPSTAITAVVIEAV